MFVVRHVGTARLDSLDTLVSTRSTKSNVSSRVESSRDEPSGIWAFLIQSDVSNRHVKSLYGRLTTASAPARILLPSMCVDLFGRAGSVAPIPGRDIASGSTDRHI